MPTETALEIQLKGTGVWRGIFVPSTIKLSALHNVIQVCMGWTDSHLHFFHSKLGTFEPQSNDSDSMPGSRDEAEFGLDELVGKKGDRISYMYDFGDSWDHDVLVKKIIPCPKRRTRAECILGEMACPPEDIGGIPGYLALCEAMTKGSPKGRKDQFDGLYEAFDPQAFDLQAVQKRLSKLRV